jgi:hypothetical protein
MNLSEVRQIAKRMASCLAPELTLTVVSARSRRLQDKWARERGEAALAQAIAEATGYRCHAGPFRGMRFPKDVIARHSSPKLLGTYERELHHHLEAAFARSPEIVVNIGMAEGYYTVGSALKLPRAHVHGFDADPAARRRTLELAKCNDVAERVHVHGIARHSHLQKLCDGRRSLFIVDCEGCELALLDIADIPALRLADLIIELHPNAVPNVAQILTERFACTHKEWSEVSKTRVLADAPSLEVPAHVSLVASMDEHRGHARQPWRIFFAN